MNKTDNPEEYWDRKLTQSVDNPYPLAPRDWVEQGAPGGEKRYRRKNLLYGEFCRLNMMAELTKLPPHGQIQVLGIGRFRDLGWVLPAAEMGFVVNLWDISGQACLMARQAVELMSSPELASSPTRRINIVKRDIVSAWKSGLIYNGQTVAYYAHQFIQVQNRHTMQWIMHHLGLSLSIGNKVAYLVHPLGSDAENRDPRQWGDTTCYTEADLRRPLEEGLGGRAKIHVLGKHMYFNQKYTFLRIGRTRP